MPSAASPARGLKARQRASRATCSTPPAGRALVIANDCMTRRKIALTAYVALSTTTSLAAARKALADWNGPAEYRDGALALLTELGGPS